MNIKRIVKVSAIIAALICLTTGCGGGRTFADGTTLNGIDISGMTVSQVNKTLKQLASSYTLTIKGDDVNVELPGSAVDMKLNSEIDLNEYMSAEYETDDSGETTEASAQTFKTDELFSFDEEKLTSCVNDLVAEMNVGCEKAENASLVYDSENHEFTLQDGAAGNEINPERILLRSKKAIGRGKEVIKLKEKDIKKARLTADNDRGEILLGEAEDMLDISLTYVFNCDVTEQLDRDTIAGWLETDDLLNVVVNEDKMMKTLKKWNKEFKSDSVNIYFDTTNGEQIVLDFPSDTEVTADLDALKEDITECLENGVSGTREVPYASGVEVPASDFGGTYVDVDISDQRIFFYKDGEMILSSDVVTGCVDNGTNTPTGVYQVYQKLTDIELTGEDYTSPVDYWIAFNGGVGFHDASWRSTFGGSIYIYNGSHGCVNMPTEKVAQLYQYIEIGDYVIVH